MVGQGIVLAKTCCGRPMLAAFSYLDGLRGSKLRITQKFPLCGSHFEGHMPWLLPPRLVLGYKSTTHNSGEAENCKETDKGRVIHFACGIVAVCGGCVSAESISQ